MKPGAPLPRDCPLSTCFCLIPILIFRHLPGTLESSAARSKENAPPLSPYECMKSPAGSGIPSRRVDRERPPTGQRGAFCFPACSCLYHSALQGGSEEQRVAAFLVWWENKAKRLRSGERKVSKTHMVITPRCKDHFTRSFQTALSSVLWGLLGVASAFCCQICPRGAWPRVSHTRQRYT